MVVEKDIVRDEERRANDREFAGIIKNYLKYEAGKMQLADWVDEAVRRITHLREMDENNEFYLLAHAHICLIGGRNDEAKQLLESYNYNRFAIGKDVELSSYYLYLTTLLSNDTIGQRKVAEELSRSFMKHPDSWKIQNIKYTARGCGRWKSSFMRTSPTVSGSICRRSGVSGTRARP